MAPLRETSALGAYWKTLRQAAGLTQADLVAQLRIKGLSISVKHVWRWEKGQHRPTSISKAYLDEVLQGDPAVSDALLLYDEEHAIQLAVLEQQAEDKTLPDDMRTQARAQLEELAEEAVVRGTVAAHEWIRERELRSLAQALADVPAEMVDEVRAIAISLYTRSPHLIDDWLRYGRFIMAEVQESSE